MPMPRIAASFTLCAAGALATLALTGLTTSAAPQTAGCENVWPHELVLVHDVAGSTLIGPYFQHLAVYNDGHAILSRTTYSPDPGAAATAFLTAHEIAELRADLVAAGVGTLCDEPSLVSDVPLTTVTYFRGTTTAGARTFSYMGAWMEHAAVEQVVQDLIAEKFPGF